MEKTEKNSGKGLYALISLLAVLLGTATVLTGAVICSVAHMINGSDQTAAALEYANQWTVLFPAQHTQADFIGRGITWILLLAAAALGAVIVLCIMSGRFHRDENGKPVLNRFDRIWSEIHLLALGSALGGAFALGIPLVDLLCTDNHVGWIDLSAVYSPFQTDQYYYGLQNNTVLAYCTAGIAACLWIAVICLVSLVKKIKARQLVSQSLLGRLLKLAGLLGRSVKQTEAGTRKARAGLRRAAGSFRKLTIPSDTDRHAAVRIMVKYGLLFTACILLPELLGFAAGNGLVFAVAELLALAAAVLFVIRKIGKLAAVRAGIVAVRSGDLTYKIPVEADENGPKTDLDKIALDINHISEATNAAVQNEIKNQRLKTDLISNVSHDLKTPLTSMISYLDILEKEGLDSEDAPAHLAIVREKTERLKTLTEELFEAAKASSGNIPCQIETIDLSALIDQSLAEMGDRLSSRNLDIRKKIRAENTFVRADGKLLYRILENLLSNISKYALEGSRVYIDVSRPQPKPSGTSEAPGKLLLEVKNISRDELNISPDELMERFTRGDQSRNTEGSGLGLAIAKDLATLMGGTFDITIDGDMFKASVLLNESLERPA